MKFLFAGFLFSASLTYGQIREFRKIIIINNTDTTILSTDSESMDSLIEINMKSMYGIDSKINSNDKNVRVEVFIDSIFNDIDNSMIALEQKADTTKVKMGKKNIVIIEKEMNQGNDDRKIIIDEDVTIYKDKSSNNDEFDNDDDADGSFFEGSWAGFGLGLNSFMNADHDFYSEADAPFLVLDYAKSVNIQLNVWEKRFPIIKEYVGLTTGIGFQWNRYGLQKNVDVFANADSIYAVNNTTVSFNKNLLRTTYLQIPLLFEFNTNKYEDKSWHLSLGVVGGVRIGS
jgi:hypothetical protein